MAVMSLKCNNDDRNHYRPMPGSSLLPSVCVPRSPWLNCEDTEASAGRSATSYNDATLDRLIPVWKGWMS
jgi:hypothetical protein